jgi:hypothetical protein
LSLKKIFLSGFKRRSALRFYVTPTSTAIYLLVDPVINTSRFPNRWAQVGMVLPLRFFKYLFSCQAILDSSPSCGCPQDGFGIQIFHSSTTDFINPAISMPITIPVSNSIQTPYIFCKIVAGFYVSGSRLGVGADPNIDGISRLMMQLSHTFASQSH